MYKVFKLWKTVSSGSTIPVYKVFDSEMWGDGEESEKAWVEDWAEREGSGSERGYTVYWDEVTDDNIIRETVDKSIDNKNRQIENLKVEIEDLKSFRNKNRKEKLNKIKGSNEKV